MRDFIRDMLEALLHQLVRFVVWLTDRFIGAEITILVVILLLAWLLKVLWGWLAPALS